MTKKILCLQIAIVFFTILSVNAQNPGELPDNVDTSECTAIPPAKSFDMRLKWETLEFPGEEDPHVCGSSTPLVADVDGDGYPEVIAVHILKSSGHSNTHKPSSFMSRDLCVFNGRTGAFKYMIKTVYYQLHGQPIAVGDVDKDGRAEIFIVSEDNKVYCYRGDHANANADDYAWIGHTGSNAPVTLNRLYIPLLADLNNDGFTELVCGESIFNAVTGVQILSGEMPITARGFGSPHNIHGDWQLNKIDDGKEYYLVALADIDGDKNLEMCAGDCIYKFKIVNPIGTSGNEWSILRQCKHELPYDNIYDGQTMVLDFDNDGDLDVCVLGRRVDMVVRNDFQNGRSPLGVYFWEGQTNELLGYFICDPKSFSQSIPFAGDLNGDGFPEIVFNDPTKGWYWTQTDNYRDRMHIFRYKKGNTSAENPACKVKNIEELFTDAETAEFSSYSGFTVFDFNQDNKAEIVYRNRESLYILDGTTLEKLCPKRDCFSGNTSEYPIVADVDCDGHADIIVSAQYIYSPGAIENSENDKAAGRIKVFESETPGAWGPARKIWNQWPYNVVNINEDGTIPQYQFDISKKFPNGTKPFNSFLQQATMLNADGDMFIPAADAEIIHTDKTFQNLCNEFVINLTYTNRGSLMLNAPYSITVYKNSLQGQAIRTLQQNTSLGVGDTTTVVIRFNENDINAIGSINKIFVAVNDAGEGIAQDGLQQLECNLVNNVDSCDFNGLRTSEEYDNPVTICEGEVYTVGDHDYTVSGDYIDTLKNHLGCDSIIKTHLTVSSIHFDFSTIRYCSNILPVTLDASSSGAAIYEWNTGATTPSIQANTNDGEGQDSWEYSVIVTNSDGCVDTSNTVTIYRNPQVELTSSIDKDQFCSIGEATLTADAVNMVNKSDVTWLWNTNETTPTISIETAHERTYTVEATYNNCKGTASFSIDECPCSVELFNAFTPNGDGINDTFAPKLEATFKYYQLIVYDRWGKSVYKSEDPTESWDGTVNGQNVSDGVYYYVFTYACMSAPLDMISKHGSITLIR